jgi:nucleoside-diphosphate-sugar epimerase
MLELAVNGTKNVIIAAAAEAKVRSVLFTSLI